MGRNVTLIPSIASAEQLCVRDEIERLGAWKTLHIDIEDGNFVPNITFGEKMIRGIAKVSNQELDAHILANHPQDYLGLLCECGVRRTAFHLEAVRYPLDILNRVRDMGISPGLAINISTSGEAVLPFAEAADYCIVMTAEPDHRGQRFYPPALSKVKFLRENLPEDVSIWVDGGINEANLAHAVDAGADTAIVGRSVFSKANPYEALCVMKNNVSVSD